MFRWSISSGPALFLALNRDEFFSRATCHLTWLSETLLAGKDEQAGGTWFGITRAGKFAFVTNVRRGARADQAERALKSRGVLSMRFLTSDVSAAQYMSQVATEIDDFDGFNLVCGELAAQRPSLFFLHSYDVTPRQLGEGDYALSNATLNTPWPKAERLRGALPSAMSDESNQRALEVMFDTEQARDETLPNTGIPLEWERALSSVMIREGASRNYGTRSTTIVRANARGARVLDVRHDAEAIDVSRAQFEWAFG